MINKWDSFFKDSVTKIFSEKKEIVDIGGGLRIDEKRNNRKNENKWVYDFLKNVDYKILDKVSDYNPDIVGDIHKLPFSDNTVDAFICMSVLEHVEEPQTAVREMYRCLKPGGYCYIDVPFLFYYHPMKGYYKDFYRFTRDGLEYMTKDFSHVEIQNVRGAFSTVMNLLPIFSKRTKFFDYIDKFFGKYGSNQTGAYRVFCIK